MNVCLDTGCGKFVLGSVGATREPIFPSDRFLSSTASHCGKHVQYTLIMISFRGHVAE